jgi:hypothetical protein
VSFISRFLEYINEIHVVKFVLIIDNITKTPESENKGLTCRNYFVLDKYLYRLCLIKVCGKIGKEMGSICAHVDDHGLLKSVRSKLDKYVIDKEL